MPDSPAAVVVARFGGVRALAAKLGIHRASVYRWLDQGRLPAHRVDAILALARRHRVRLTRAEALLGR